MAFIGNDPALAEACRLHPDVLSNYAPQLLIPGLSGSFDSAFDGLLAKSEAQTRRMPDSRYPGAICEKRYALRRLDFGNHVPRDIADKWVNGGGQNSAKHWHFTDYIVWLLSAGSAWLPDRVSTVLIEGMREWAAWDQDLSHEDVWDPIVAGEIYGRARRSVRWTGNLRQRLEGVVNRSLSRLGVQDSASEIAKRFIDLDFIGVRDEMVRRRRR